MIRKNLFLVLVAITATMSMAIIGCGVENLLTSDADESEIESETGYTDEDGLIVGSADEVTNVVPEVGIYKTTITRGDTTETSFHLETDIRAPWNIVVLVSYDDGKSGEFIVIRKGDYQSEAFEFAVDDDVVNTVTVQPDTERDTVSRPRLAKNSEPIRVPQEYNLALYPYSIDPSNTTVSR